MGRTAPELDHGLPMMSGETSGVNPSLLGDFDLLSASAYQAELDYLSFPFMDSFLTESSGGDLTFALVSALDAARPPSHSSGSSSPSGSSLRSPVTPPQQQSFHHHSSSHHDHHRTWSMTSATTDPTDLDSPFPLFTENIFSPSFIPKPPQSQCFPSDENSCDDDDHSEEDVLACLLDLQTRISNLVKRFHEGRGGSSSNDCKDILSAGKLLIGLLDGVAVPSRMMSGPASPMSTSSSSSSASSSRSIGGRTMPNNVLILSLSSCYATLLHAYELLLNSQQSVSNPSHSQTPLLSPASSISSSMSSSPEELDQQGYFFNNGLRLPITPPGKSDIQVEAMAQVMQKLKYALRRCTVRMSGQSQRQRQGSKSTGTSISAKKRKQTEMGMDDDILSVMGLASPALLEMGWTEDVLWQQQPFGLGMGMGW